MMRHMDTVQRQHVTELMQQIESQMESTSGSSSEFAKKLSFGVSAAAAEDKEVNVVVSKLDKLKDELDDYIASECLLCGSIMIDRISQPFVSMNDAEIGSWAI